MNEIKKCSISGISFTMEIDAYKTLNDYLETLKRTYGNEKDGDEITADIEARIAELILSTQDNDKIVERPLIANIIAQLGSAEDISEESSTEEKKPTEPRIPRRMYRDMDNARLGGVCAGIAKYFAIDPTWIRLGVFAPILLMFASNIPFFGWLDDLGGSLFGVVILSYLVMWFAVPAARTPRQKLEMNGEKITAQSIRETAASSNDIDNTARPVIADTVTVFGKVLTVLLKIFAAIIIFGLMLIAMGLIIGMFTLGITGGDFFDSFGPASSQILGADTTAVLGILGILVVLIPTILLLYILICLVINHKTNRTALLVMFILWVLTFIALPVAAVKLAVSKNDAPVHATVTTARDVEEHERLVDSIDNLAERFTLPEAEKKENAKRSVTLHIDSKNKDGEDQANIRISIDED